MERTRSTAIALARWGLFAGAALYLVVLVVLAAVRIPYPYELEWMEGGTVDAVRRILDGRTIYPEPSLEFIPFLYTPLYFYVSAALAAMTGVGYLPLRLVAFASSLCCMALIFVLVRRETRSAWGAGLAAFLFAAMFELTGWWFDVARADTLFLLLVLAAIGVLRFREGTRGGLVTAGSVLFLAFFTKQTALFVAVPLVAWAILVHGRRALWFAGTFGALVLASTLVMERWTDGWYLYYVIETPSTHPVWKSYSTGFWTNDLARPLWAGLAIGLATVFAANGRWIVAASRRLALPVAVGAASLALASGPLGLEKAGALGVALGFAVELALARRPEPFTAEEQGRALWTFAFVGLVVAGWYVRRRTGSFNNIVIPTYGGVALLFGLGLARLVEMARGRTFVELAVLALVAFQFFHLRYDPRDQVPSDAQRATYARFVERLGELEGEVFVPEHPWLPTLAGKSSSAHRLAIQDCFTERVAAELDASLSSRRWAAVLLDRRWERVAAELEANYVARGPFLDAPLRPMTGLFARHPPTLWTPRGDAEEP